LSGAKDRVETAAILALTVALGLAVRYAVWIYPVLGPHGLTIYDTGTYLVYGLSYVQAITSMNLTALASINPGVPPLSMLLTGLSIHALGQIVGAVQASLIPPITASALTSIPAYVMARRGSSRYRFIAPMLVALDPFLIQYSAAYLDALGTLFAATSAAYLTNSRGRGSFILATLFACLAILTKLTFILFIASLAILLRVIGHIDSKRALLYIAAPASSLLLSPWMWTATSIATSVTGNLTFNNLPLSPIAGPFAIGVPHSLPWYLLTYLGMGQVSWNTLPSATPLVLLVAIIYRATSKRLSIPPAGAAAAAAMILTIFLLPRNYWTYSWAGGFLQGVLARQFYPYYFYPIAPLLAPLVANLLTGGAADVPAKKRIVTYPILINALLSPLAFTMNLGLPYWDFIFTLIYSYPTGGAAQWGLAATMLTAVILAASVAIAEILHRSIAVMQAGADNC